MMSIKRHCFQFYWKVRRLIAPRLTDAQAVYEEHLGELVTPSRHWLDVGCGHQVLQAWRSEAERNLVSRAGVVVGLDLEAESLKRHRSIQRRVAADLSKLPFADSTFDLVTANMVLEHLREPGRQVAEIFRVLKPGGSLMALTPNVLGYQVMLARCMPGPLKRGLIKVLQDRASEDVFPAYYRINSEHTITRIASEAGFSKVVVEHVSTDAQLIAIPPLVVPELFLIRLLMTNPLRRLRPNLIAILQKAAAR
jgi:ubiquinone/menaquinone biosynthesis C-methylase UbiE